MAEQTRSSVLALKEESTEGTLETTLVGTDFTVMREGFSFEATATENIESDELLNGIGASKSAFSKEIPTASINKYLKHSGVEGQEPSYGILIESAMGSKEVNATEYDTIAGSTVGTSSVAATVVVDAAEGLNYQVGEAIMIKSAADASGNYAIRNIKSIATDTLTLNYNITTAPGVGVNLGKAVSYLPVATGHKTFSAHHFQASAASSAFHQAMAGCRTTSLSLEFPAGQFAEINADFEGIDGYFNPLTVDATNDDIDFNVTGPVLVAAAIPQKTYKTPIALASAIETAMNGAQATDVVSVSYDNATGKYTFLSDGSLFEILFKTGVSGSDNTDTHIGTLIGFSDAADDTGALTYTGASALSYEPQATPVFDSSDPIVMRNAEVTFGPFDRKECRDASNVSVTIDTPKSDVNSICAATGVSSSLTLERSVTISMTVEYKKHEVQDADHLFQNTTTQVMVNGGTKTSSGNWTPGQCFNVWLGQASLTSNVIADEDGIVVKELEFAGFITSSEKDFYINFL